jgi:hypothetical protein
MPSFSDKLFSITNLASHRDSQVTCNVSDLKLGGAIKTNLLSSQSTSSHQKPQSSHNSIGKLTLISSSHTLLGMMLFSMYYLNTIDVPFYHQDL